MGGGDPGAALRVSHEARLYLLALTVVVLAFHVSGARRALRPLAWLLLGGFVGDLTRRLVREVVLVPAAAALAGEPLTGWPRVAGHVSQGLFLGWGAGVLAVAVWTFTERSSWVVALVLWAATWLAAILDYPALRGDALGRFYMGWTMGVVVLSGLCAVRFAIQRRRPRQEHVAALWLLMIEGSLLLGPYLGKEPYSAWWTAQIAYAAMYLGLTPILAVGALWSRPKL